MIPTETKRAQGISQARVWAIVVSWQGAALLPACLRSLLAQTGEADLHVLVVDNGSTDGSAALVTRDFPAVELLPLSENLGYGKANNLGLRRALSLGATHALLVNNDVELAPDYLERLLGDSGSHPDAGLFTGTLLFHGEETVNSTGLTIDGLGRASDRDFRLPRARLQRPDGPVAGVSGGAALLTAPMLRAVGLFDPAYFAYYEDVDLSLRAARCGFGCRYVSGALARHRFGATFGPGSPLQRYLLGRNHLRTLALHQPALRAAALVPATAAFRIGFKAPLELLQRRPRLAWAEVRAAVAGTAAALAALPLRLRGGIPPGASP